MAIAFRSVANTTYASRTNTTITAPASIANDDILLIFGLTGAVTTAPTATPPSGFAAPTLAAGAMPTTVSQGGFNVKSWLWWKRASSESGNYTFTHTASSSQGICMAISGGITSGDPTDVANSNSAATGTTSTGLAVTTTVADTLLVFFGHDFGDTANNLTAPSEGGGMTERVDVAPLVYAATQAIAATGSTGNRTMTNNSTSGTPWATFMIALKPDTGGATDQPISKRFGGVPGMAFPGRGNVWAPYRRLIWPGHRILKPA